MTELLLLRTVPSELTRPTTELLLLRTVPSDSMLPMDIAARAKGIRTVLLTGMKEGCCRKFADEVLAVPELETFKIQELHLPVYHALCLAVESSFFRMMESK